MIAIFPLLSIAFAHGNGVVAIGNSQGYVSTISILVATAAIAIDVEAMCSRGLCISVDACYHLVTTLCEDIAFFVESMAAKAYTLS